MTSAPERSVGLNCDTITVAKTAYTTACTAAPTRTTGTLQPRSCSPAMKSLAAHEYPNNPTIWNKSREQAIALRIPLDDRLLGRGNVRGFGMSPTFAKAANVGHPSVRAVGTSWIRTLLKILPVTHRGLRS